MTGVLSTGTPPLRDFGRTGHRSDPVPPTELVCRGCRSDNRFLRDGRDCGATGAGAEFTGGKRPTSSMPGFATSTVHEAPTEPTFASTDMLVGVSSVARGQRRMTLRTSSKTGASENSHRQSLSFDQTRSDNRRRRTPITRGVSTVPARPAQCARVCAIGPRALQDRRWNPISTKRYPQR